MTTDPATIADVLDRAAWYLKHPDVTAIPFALASSSVARDCEQLAAEVRAAPIAPRYLAIYIGCSNDTNGNPRRGWYVSRIDGEPMIPEVPPNGRSSGKDAAYTVWVAEGYMGQSAPVYAIALHLNMPMVTWQDIAAVKALVRETGRIEVTPAEYRSARKLPRFGGGA